MLLSRNALQASVLNLSNKNDPLGVVCFPPLPVPHLLVTDTSLNECVEMSRPFSSLMSAFQGNVTKQTGKEVEVKKRLKRLNKCFDTGI